MTGHVTELLEAYHDGELQGRRLEHVEDHLAQCSSCRAELRGLQSLAALLHESLAPAGLMPPDRFAAQVALRLPPTPERPVWQKALHRIWQATPVGLLGAWAAVQVAFLVAGVVVVAARLGLAGSLSTSLLPAVRGGLPRLSANSVSDLAQSVLSVLGSGGPLGWGVTLNLALSALIGLLYWGWLASWWVRTRSQRA